jgi:hypothetical protein
MAVIPLPVLDRTSATFKTDTDTFFGSQLPQFSVEVNQVATDAQTSATAANSSKTAAATSATNATNSATAANTSKTNAASSETAAATSATNAATSATNAANSATAAANSATAANSSKNAAATSATSALSEANRAKAAADSIASGPVTSVNGKTGVVALVKADVGLGSVDNVSVVAAGIGTASFVALANIDDVTLTNGWYSVTEGSLGTRPPNVLYGVLLVSGRNFTVENTRVVQTLMRTDSGSTKIFSRTCYSGTWGGWVEITLPALTGNARKPLTPGEGATVPEWSDTLSIPKYIDKLVTNSSAAGTVILNFATGSVFEFTLVGNATLSLTNLPSLSGESLTVVIRIRQNASPKTITWFSGITWLTYGGVVPPTPGANQIIEYVLSTTGTGTTWVGRVGAST